MEEIGIFNDRKLIYQRHAFDANWAKLFPDKNWLLLVVVESKNRTILDEISRKAIDKNVCYVCCAGEQAERLHDMIDEEIGFREVDIGNHHLPPYQIMTTWEVDFNEAVWFAFFAAHNPTEDIYIIVCLDASDVQIKFKLVNLVNSFT